MPGARMSLLLRLIPAWVPVAIILLATLMGTVLLAQRNHARIDASIARQALSQDRATAAQAALSASQQYRAKESAWNNAYQGAMNALLAEQDKTRRFAADLRSARLERDGLRDQIASFAGGGDASTDTLTACRSRSVAIGRLLDEGLRVQEELAADGESCESKLRAVLAAWPR
jgi:hypothetical protein